MTPLDQTGKPVPSKKVPNRTRRGRMKMGKKKKKNKRTQASAGQEIPYPSSHPQDSRVERGEGGLPPQVTWRNIIWSIANPCPPVLAPGLRPLEADVQSGNPEGSTNKFPAAGAPRMSPHPSPSPTKAPLEPPPWNPPRPRPSPQSGQW